MLYVSVISVCVHLPSHTDSDVRNIIDKLAVFVARNGVEFEQMTMEKQRENPKFKFLFGGESNVYYRWRVGQEQASLYGQPQQQTGVYVYCGRGCREVYSIVWGVAWVRSSAAMYKCICILGTRTCLLEIM